MGNLFLGIAMTYKHYSTKTFGNDRGLSCVFRQPKATHSHCSLLHGYSLGFKFIFGADELDDKNWVFDFGGMKFIKEFLEQNFDHTWVIDVNDPQLLEVQEFCQKTNMAKLVILSGVGCEKFAEYVAKYVAEEVYVISNSRVKLVSVECFEHGANSAIYTL